MARASPIQTNFNAGRLSTRLEGRVDLAKYANGCRVLQNFIPQIQGPAEKRPGTRFVADANQGSNPGGQPNSHVRLIPFEFSTDDAYILEFTNRRFRIYRNEGRVIANTVTFRDRDVELTAEQIILPVPERHFLINAQGAFQLTTGGTETFIDGGVNIDTDVIEVDLQSPLFAHQFITGQGPVRLTTTGVLPTGLALATDYFIINIPTAANRSLQFALSQSDADTGVAVDVTAATGGGVHTITPEGGLPGGLALATDYFIVDIAEKTLTFTDQDVDVAEDEIDFGVDHDYGIGEGPFQLTSTGTLPAGLALATNYWIKAIGPPSDDQKINLSLTKFGADVDITAAAGGGVHTLTPVRITAADRFGLALTANGVPVDITTNAGGGTHILTPQNQIPAEVVTPYAGDRFPFDGSTSQIFELHFTQSADVMFLAHSRHPPMKLSRLDHDKWTLEEIDFDWPAFEPENIDEMLNVVSTVETGSGQLISADGIFTPEHVNGFFKQRVQLAGRYATWLPGVDPYGATRWLGETFVVGSRIQHEGNVYELADLNGVLVTGSIAPIHTEGTHFDGGVFWRFLHSGSGYGEITKFTNGFRVDYEVRRQIPRDAVSAGIVVSNVSNAATAVVTLAANTFETGDEILIHDVVGLEEVNDRAFLITRLTPTTFELDGFNTSTFGAYVSGGVANRTRSADLGTAANTSNTNLQSDLWSLGAWSDRNGFPRTNAFFEDRLWWAGSIRNPQTLWASVTGEFENHEITDLDESGLIFTLNTDKVNAIEWLSPGKVLAVGTAGGEFIAAASTLEQPLTPGNIRVVRHANFGSRAGVMPQAIEQVVLFVQRSGGRIRELVFDFDTDSFVAPDLTVLSDDLFGKSVLTGSKFDKAEAPRTMAFQQEPKRNLWVALDSGELICLTYDRAQQVVGWHTHEIGDDPTWSVQSVAVIPHPDGDGDQLWLAVRVGTSSFNKIQIMFMEKPWHEDRALEDAFYVDSGLTFDPDPPAPTTVLTGLDHLEGRTVEVLGDGIRRARAVVSGGSINIGEPAVNVAQVGLAYDAILQTMRFEAGSQEGTAQGKIKRITKFVVRLFQTGVGLRYGAEDDDRLEDLPQDVAATAADLKDGDTDALSWPQGYEQAGRVLLKHSTPFPCFITAIMPQISVQDR